MRRIAHAAGVPPANQRLKCAAENIAAMEWYARRDPPMAALRRGEYGGEVDGDAARSDAGVDLCMLRPHAQEAWSAWERDRGFPPEWDRLHIVELAGQIGDGPSAWEPGAPWAVAYVRELGRARRRVHVWQRPSPASLLAALRAAQRGKGPECRLRGTRLAVGPPPRTGETLVAAPEQHEGEGRSSLPPSSTKGKDARRCPRAARRGRTLVAAPEQHEGEGRSSLPPSSTKGKDARRCPRAARRGRTLVAAPEQHEGEGGHGAAIAVGVDVDAPWGDGPGRPRSGPLPAAALMIRARGTGAAALG
eukprot:gene13677-28175_t